jgi:GNAT superfamily N-acetyltransferase
VDTIAVDPQRWRSGIGRALMEHAVTQLTLDGYRRAVLWTLSDYPLGEAFYRATGWRQTDQIRAGGSEVCFSRSLT